MRAKVATRRAIALVLIAVLLIPTTNIYSISIEYNNKGSNSDDDNNTTIIDTNNSKSIDYINEQAITDRLLSSRISFPFIANVGQYDHNIKYYTDTFVGRVLIYDDNDIVYMLKGSDTIIKERLIGSNILLVADDDDNRSITNVNYFIGDKVFRDIPTYKSISMIKDDKIELVLKAYNNNVEKVFILKPYADINDLIMEVDGISSNGSNSSNNSISIRIDDEGRLLVSDGIAFTRPIAYQNINGNIVDVDVSYKIIGENRYTFSVGNYDERYELIIDPLIDLAASTYLGGSDSDYAYAIAIDSSNNVFVAGRTASSNFPIVNGYDSTYNENNENRDAFVAKFSNDLNELLASTYLGGSGWDRASAIAIDSSNNVFIAGWTESYDFPIVNGYDSTYNGEVDAFVAKFSNDLNELLASTYLGGSNGAEASAIAIDSSNNVFIAGWTVSDDFPIVNGYDSTYNGEVDAFVAKFSNDLNELLASTYLGGSNFDYASAIAIDSSNNVFIAGWTTSDNFPIVNGYDSTYNEYIDAFVAKFSNDLNELLASTYLGGSNWDRASAIAIDSSNNVFIAGWTTSDDFPIVNGYESTYNDGWEDAFVAKFSNDLNELLASTYLGGSNFDYAYAIAIDSSNNVFIAGETESYDFPIVNGYDSTYNGNTDAFVAKFSISTEYYNLQLFEDGNPSDGIINLGNNITAKATTKNLSVTDVRFIWVDPTGDEVRDITKDLVDGEASDTFTPDQVGTWRVITEFSDGTMIVKVLSREFNVFELATVYGYKFIDHDGDGVQDEDEGPLAGVTICAFNWAIEETWVIGEVCTITDATGYYSIDIPAGNIRVYELVPSGYIPTTPPSGYYFTSIGNGESIRVDFGNMPLTPIPDDIDLPNSNDYNNDGIPEHIRGADLVIEKDLTEVLNAAGKSIDDIVSVEATVRLDDNTTRSTSMSRVGDTNVYRGVIEGPFYGNMLHLTVTVDFAPAGSDPYDAIEEGDIILIDPRGRVLDAMTNKPIEGATVTLYIYDPSIDDYRLPTDAEIEPDTNPQITGIDGSYSWMTVAGTYKVVASALGYITNEAIVTVPPPATDVDIYLTPITYSFNTDKVIVNLGESITAEVSTNNPTVTDVRFIWVDPTGDEVRDITKDLVDGEASDTFTPDQVGTWRVITEFSDGTMIVAEVNAPFRVAGMEEVTYEFSNATEFINTLSNILSRMGLDGDQISAIINNIDTSMLPSQGTIKLQFRVGSMYGLGLIMPHDPPLNLNENIRVIVLYASLGSSVTINDLHVRAVSPSGDEYILLNEDWYPNTIPDPFVWISEEITVNEVGEWSIVSDFTTNDGNISTIVLTLQVSFGVVPEFIIGMIALIGSSLAALAVYRRRRVSNSSTREEQ